MIPAWNSRGRFSVESIESKNQIFRFRSGSPRCSDVMADSRDVSDSVHLISTPSVGISAMTAPRVGMPPPTLVESKSDGRRGGAHRMVEVAAAPIDHRRANPADIRYVVVRRRP